MTRLWMHPWSTTEQLWTSIALIGVWIASIPTAFEAFKKGNEADPLGREILREREKEETRTSADGQQRQPDQ